MSLRRQRGYQTLQNVVSIDFLPIGDVALKQAYTEELIDETNG